MNNTDLNDASFTFTKDSRIITDDEVYAIDLLPDLNNPDVKILPDVAYIDNGYYYVYQGDVSPLQEEPLKCGLYKNRKDNMYFIVEPVTDEQKKEFSVTEHVAKLFDVSNIIDIANKKEEILVAIPESTKIFKPTIDIEDDILKRALKMVLIAKEVDLDRYKDQFLDKNALFNFKQVIRGKSKVSILIFNRGIEALHLKYTLMIEEQDPTNGVGKLLESPIIVSSEDTYTS